MQREIGSLQPIRSAQDEDGSLRLKKLRFYVGTAPNLPPLEVTPGSVLLLVGPNNSGKSMALREIEDGCLGEDKARKVLDEIEIDFPTRAEKAYDLVEAISFPPEVGGSQDRQIWRTFRYSMAETHGASDRHVDLRMIKQWIDNHDLKNLRTFLTWPYTIRLDGKTRFNLVQEKPANPVDQAPMNHLGALTALFVSVDHVVASPEAVTRREGHDQWRRKPLYEEPPIQRTAS